MTLQIALRLAPVDDASGATCADYFKARGGIFQLKQEGTRREIGLKTPSVRFTPAVAKCDHAEGERDDTRELCNAIMSGILIYENDDLMCALLQEWLREAGYRVRADASLEGPADLVIVSIYMPKHAGAQQVREVQAAHPGTPLIAISGHFHSGLSAAGSTAQTLGVQQVIAKPLTRGDLLDAVRTVIGLPT